MSLLELFNRLKAESTFSLNSSSLDSAGDSLFPLLGELSAAEITLSVETEPSWTDTATQSEFTITAISQTPLLGMGEPHVTFTAFTLPSTKDVIQFRLEVITTLGWSFGTSFPQLARTEVDRLSFSDSSPPSFLLTTVGIGPESTNISSGTIYPPGLNFRGELQLTNSPILAAVEELIDGPSHSSPVIGHIEKNENHQLITLKTEIFSGVASFDLVDLLKFQFSKPNLAFYAYLYPGSQAALLKRIEGDVTLSSLSTTSTHKPVSLPLALELPTLVTGWQMMLQPNQQTSLLEFTEFLTLLGSAGKFDLMSIFTGHLEAVKNVLSSLILKSFSIEIVGSLKTAPKFRSFSFQIQQKENDPWKIIAKKLELANLQIYLRISKEASSYSTIGFIQGELDITDSVAINATIPIPVGSSDWQFYSRHSIELSDINILSKFTEDNSVSALLPESLVKSFSSLTLRELSLIYNPGAGIKQLNFAVSMEESWVIVQNSFELASLHLQFEIEKDTSGWGLSGDIQSVLIAGGIAIDSQVQKLTPGSDWFFSLHANQVPLPSLSDLGELTGGEHALADALPNRLLTAQLYLNNPRLEFDISQRKLESFGFSLVTEEVFFSKDIKIIAAGLDVDIVFSSHRNIEIYGSFIIADIDFFVRSTYTDSEAWQFTGQAALSKSINIGELLGKLDHKFDVDHDVPDFLKTLLVLNLESSFNTQTKDFTFSVETQMEIDSQKLDAVIAINITHNNGKYTRKFSGIIHVNDLEFDLIFQQQQDADNIFLAAYENQSGKDESIKALAKLITTNQALLTEADGISFNLKDALLVIDKGAETKILFGLDIGSGLDISKLPLVGKMFPAHATVRMAFQPLLTNKDFTSANLNTIRPLVPTAGYQLPQTATTRLGFNIKLLIGSQVIDLDLPIGVNDVKQQLPSTTALPASASSASPSADSLTPSAAPPPATTAKIKWFPIQKQLGPIYFGRVGIQFENSKLYFFLDASLSLAGLTISLDGLYVSSTLNPIHPKFGLHGLGIDYANGPLEIAGAFLRTTQTDLQGQPYDTYDGTVIIRTEKFALAALGSYAYYQGHPSLFIYAFVDIPLGGPSFFFVTGLAAGFGYNRRLIVPSIDKVKTFPLVAEAMAGVPEPGTSLNDELAKLHSVIPPAVGESFLAVGVRFSSFEIIDSFVLLSVSLGLEFEVDVLGLSTLVLPTPEAGQTVEPLAEIQMALKAVFNPNKGFLKVRAALTSVSFILSRDCHLTGGFAFYTWFKENPIEKAAAGDFVLTLGGYHPRFKPPAHYPKVAPLGFSWHVSHELFIKGDFYFALVPSAVMAGGHLSATWSSGNLKAWFRVGADFIISWQPYFYDASMYLNMGVSYTYHFFGTHHISVDVGADLHIWGPEFSGKAHVHLWIVTFDVSFGAHSNPTPPALTWEQFRSSFLPSKLPDWVTVSVTQGLIKKLGPDNAPLFVINPKDFTLETSTVLPVTISSNHALDGVNKNINIGSMQITDGVDSTHNITINQGTTDVTADFQFIPVKKHVPGALWGDKLKHSESESEDERLVKNACMGFSITGKQAVPSNETHDIDSEKLLNENEPFGSSITYEKLDALESLWLKSDGVRKKIFDEIETKITERHDLLKDLGFQDTYYPNKELAEEFILTTV